MSWSKLRSYYGYAIQSTTTRADAGYGIGGGGSTFYPYGSTPDEVGTWGGFAGGLLRLDLGVGQMKDSARTDNDLWIPMNIALGFAGGYVFAPNVALALEYEFLTVKSYSTMALAGSSLALSAKVWRIEGSYQVEKSGFLVGVFKSNPDAFLVQHTQFAYQLRKWEEGNGLAIGYQRSNLIRGAGSTFFTHENRLIVSYMF